MTNKPDKSKPSPIGEARPEPTQQIPRTALQEIRTIHWSLEAAVNLFLEASGDEYLESAQLIRPAVERLGAIIDENRFAE